MRITHQTQPNQWSCGHTCLAMVMGVDVRRVLRRYPKPGGLNQKELFSMLSDCRMTWNAYVFGTIFTPGYYILTVPSLNQEGTAHYILARYNRSGSFTVFDPQRGNKGRRFYGRGGVALKYWGDVVHIRPGGQLPSHVRRRG